MFSVSFVIGKSTKSEPFEFGMQPFQLVDDGINFFSRVNLQGLLGTKILALIEVKLISHRNRYLKLVNFFSKIFEL